MSLQDQLPTSGATAQPQHFEREPRFSIATFHSIAARPLRELIDLSPLPASTVMATEVSPPKSNWRRHISSARLSWHKLSSGELERVDGDQAKLIKLLLRHYSMDRHEAGRLVRNFFERNKI